MQTQVNIFSNFVLDQKSTMAGKNTHVNEVAQSKLDLLLCTTHESKFQQLQLNFTFLTCQEWYHCVEGKGFVPAAAGSLLSVRRTSLTCPRARPEQCHGGSWSWACHRECPEPVIRINPSEDDTLPCMRQALAWQKEPKAWTQALQRYKHFFYQTDM